MMTTDVHTTFPSGSVEENSDVKTPGMGVTTVGTSGGGLEVDGVF